MYIIEHDDLTHGLTLDSGDDVTFDPSRLQVQFIPPKCELKPPFHFISEVCIYRFKDWRRRY